MKYTIKDIAAMAKVSPSAVSIALNNRTGISDETRKRILAIVEEANYTPNLSSRRLVNQKTNNIAVLFKKNTSPLENFFYADLNGYVLHECEQRGYNVVFTSVAIESEKVILPDVIRSYDVDGIISYGDIDTAVPESIQQLGIPYMLIDCHYLYKDTMSVTCDYASAAATAVEYLLSCGHKRIAYIGSGSESLFAQNTLLGYRNALDAAGIEINPAWLKNAARDELTAYSLTSELLQTPPPTAIFCAADIYAIGAIRCIKEAGLSVPKDISVIGIDDIILSRYIDPPLTTVRIDRRKMAHKAVDILTHHIENKEGTLNKTCRGHELIVRQSVGKIK